MEICLRNRDLCHDWIEGHDVLAHLEQSHRVQAWRIFRVSIKTVKSENVPQNLLNGSHGTAINSQMADSLWKVSKKQWVDQFLATIRVVFCNGFTRKWSREKGKRRVSPFPVFGSVRAFVVGHFARFKAPSAPRQALHTLKTLLKTYFEKWYVCIRSSWLFVSVRFDWFLNHVFL